MPSSNISLEVSDGQSPSVNSIGTPGSDGSLYPSDGIITFESSSEFSLLNSSNSMEYKGSTHSFPFYSIIVNAVYFVIV